jgi:hypothetical protein
MSNHQKIAPIVVYHLSIHHWQRDMTFLANTYTFMADLSVFAIENSCGVCLFLPKTTYHHGIYQAFVGFFRKTYLTIVKQS